MQTTLLGLAIAIILALLAALVGPLLIDWGGHRSLFEAEASRLIGIDVRVTGEIVADLGGGPFDWATKPEDRTRLWQARHDGYWAARSLRPGAQAFATDVCVPISRLAECVKATQQATAELKLVAPILGHVGDGNFHLSLLVDMSDADEVRRAGILMERVVELALAMDGTCTGEHGVGQGKMKYLLAEHGAPALAAMAAIKRALDPQNIMNPGKIVALS